jgi:hypothetical protein
MMLLPATLLLTWVVMLQVTSFYALVRERT